jgi:hypothetical protein
MKMIDAIVVWTPDTNLCRVETKGSSWERTPGDFWMSATGFGEWGGFKHKDDFTRLLAMFVLFNTITVRDKVDPQVAHDAFLNIDEYRSTISPDCRGARKTSEATTEQ